MKIIGIIIIMGNSVNKSPNKAELIMPSAKEFRSIEEISIKKMKDKEERDKQDQIDRTNAIIKRHSEKLGREFIEVRDILIKCARENLEQYNFHKTFGYKIEFMELFRDLSISYVDKLRDLSISYVDKHKNALLEVIRNTKVFKEIEKKGWSIIIETSDRWHLGCERMVLCLDPPGYEEHRYHKIFDFELIIILYLDVKLFEQELNRVGNDEYDPLQYGQAFIIYKTPDQDQDQDQDKAENCND